MTQPILPFGATALLLLASAIAFTPGAAAWPDRPCPDGELPVVTAYHYESGGVEYVDLTDFQAGAEVTVVFTMEGCGERSLAFVAYDATADFTLEGQEVNNYAIEYFMEGEGQLTLSVPDCFYQLAFVYGDVIFAFDSETGVNYSDQDRLIDGIQAGSACEPTPPPPTPCPTDVGAVANADGSITLSFTPAAGSDGSNLFRAEGDGDFVFKGHLAAGASTTTDTDIEAGVAYSYMVTGTFGQLQSEGCGAVEVSAIPEFPTGIAAALAGACGILSYAFLRRKK